MLYRVSGFTDTNNTGGCTGFSNDIIIKHVLLLQFGNGFDRLLVFVNVAFDVYLVVDHDLRLGEGGQVSIPDGKSLVGSPSVEYR